nr:UDP-N-acetylmuramoyl-tripeptide--D-alanyl-D-alanine ligase [Nesterenkonia alkaliphila]
MGEAPFGPQRDYLYAEGTYEFIQAAGLAGRRRAAEAGKPIAAVTGSAGKSTFKAMLQAAYQACCPRHQVLSPPTHFNTYIRVLSELTRAADHDLTLLELSAGGRGAFFREAIPNGTPISPEVAVITNISHAHTKVMKHLSGVVKQKSEILKSPPPGGTAVINHDTLRSRDLQDRALAEGWNLLTYGQHDDAAYRLLDYNPAESTVQAQTPAGTLRYRIGAHGHHMAGNSLAVLAALHALGVQDTEPAFAAFESFQALPGRGETAAVDHPAGGQVHLIDETYNANPSSMTAALQSLAARQAGAGRQRRIAVLGDMHMLGQYELKLHRRIIESLSDYGLDRIYLCGELMGQAYEQTGPQKNITHLPDTAALTRQLNDDLRGGDTVMLKASNSMNLDEVLTQLVTQWHQNR